MQRENQCSHNIAKANPIKKIERIGFNIQYRFNSNAINQFTHKRKRLFDM